MLFLGKTGGKTEKEDRISRTEAIELRVHEQVLVGVDCGAENLS